MKIGIPKALYYYYIEDFIRFLKKLGIEIVTFDTDKEIINLGSNVANDEMCLPMKIFLGHVCKLKDVCDYILVPNLNNYGLFDQMCPNFTALYNLVNNLFDVKILTFDINYLKNRNNAFYKVGQELGFTKKHIKKVYKQAMVEYKSNLKTKILNNENKLNSKNKKVLLVSHSYNAYDKYISQPIIKYLESLNCEIIYSDCFDNKITNDLSKYLSRDLYFKSAKENIGSIILCKEKIDGILFLTAFPCGIDSLVTELVMRKIDKPYLNLVIDDLDSLSGVMTRLESFVDIIEQN
jgi:predicted nucleotide-binding protein (sugar kinase/HSP70/actin superfamily)